MARSNSPTNYKIVAGDVDSVDKAPNSSHVNYLDIGALVYGIILHFVDAGFDIFLAYSYFVTEQYSYFAWTVAFFIVPAVVMSAVSVRMYIEDANGNLANRRFLLRPLLCVVGLVVQLAPVIRYADSIKYARKSLKAESKGDRKLQEDYYKKMLKEDSDAALLRVFECYIESAFQQALQLTILLTDYSQGIQIHLVKQCIMITLSFVSMGWCMATYSRCIRFDRDDKPNISRLGTAAQFFWHLNLTVSRIIALVAVGILYPFWMCIAVASHWCGMTIWVAVTSKTNFCGKSLILEVLFSSAVGLIYIFNFISLNDGSTRKSYIAFFTICGIENVAASIVWGLQAGNLLKDWIYYIFLTLPVVTFLLSIIFLVIYYSVLHPTKSVYKLKKQKNIFSQSDSIPGLGQEQEIKFDDE